MRAHRVSRLAAWLLFTLVMLGGCRFQAAGDPVVLNGDWPIVYVKRSVGAWNDPTSGASFKSGSDLYIRDIASPNAPEKNITKRLTHGSGKDVDPDVSYGAVADPDVSYDGTKVVFSLRCAVPPQSSPECGVDTTWNIWIYNVLTGDLSPVIKDYDIANKGDDLDPTFLPDGRILFVSNRQKKTKDALGYAYVDEDQKAKTLLLHRMTSDGQDIEQISFNQSHDLNPSVMHDGRILFSRWDHVAGRNKISLYTAKPDGSDMRVLYGAHSPGEAFMFPRELADGRVLSTVMPRDGTWRGGALLLLDVKHYGDDADPAPAVAALKGRGQNPATAFEIPIDRKAAKLGRYTSPYLTEDGTNRALVSYGFYKLGKKLDVQTKTEVPDSDSESAFEYGIYMLDLDDKSMKPLVLPEAGFAFTDPVPVRPRPRPYPQGDRVVSTSPRINAGEDVGFIHVRSVYDTDELGHMSNGVLTSPERVSTSVPTVVPADPAVDNRRFVADLAKIKDPLQTNASQRPARFVRVSKAVPQPAGLDRRVVGLTPFNMQNLVGYAPIEPDGSFFIKVPADTSLTLTVLDAKGRAFATHTAWVQVRPGEQLTCNGCHEPLRGTALNGNSIAGNHPNTQLRDISGAVLAETNPSQLLADHETMAQTRVRLDPSAANLQTDIEFVDVWTNLNQRQADPTLKIRYADLATAAPIAGVLDYVTHIQPIFDRARAGGSCSSCHNGVASVQNNPTALDLRATINAGDGRPASYNGLLQGSPVFLENGQLVFETVGDARKLRRRTSLVQAGHARSSFLVEKIFNEELYADAGLPSFGLNHGSMLTDAERRLVVEWIDQGAQFANVPLDANRQPRRVKDSLDFRVFLSTVWPVAKTKCNVCHYPYRPNGDPNGLFTKSRFILTFDQNDDYQVILAYVNALNPAQSEFLVRPSALVAHPPNNEGNPIMAPTTQEYKDVMNWLTTPVPP